MSHDSGAMPQATEKLSWPEARALVLRELRSIGSDVRSAAKDERRRDEDRKAAASIQDGKIDAAITRLDAIERRLNTLDAPEVGLVTKNRHAIDNVRQAYRIRDEDDAEDDRPRRGGVRRTAVAGGAGVGIGGGIVYALAKLLGLGSLALSVHVHDAPESAAHRSRERLRSIPVVDARDLGAVSVD